MQSRLAIGSSSLLTGEPFSDRLSCQPKWAWNPATGLPRPDESRLIMTEGDGPAVSFGTALVP